MIGYISRELAGWVLILIGLWFFFQSFLMLNSRLVPISEYPGATVTFTDGAGTQYTRTPSRIISAPPVAFIGFIIFRGGIHLLKVAVAARTSQQARRELLETARRSRIPQAKPPIRR